MTAVESGRRTDLTMLGLVTVVAALMGSNFVALKAALDHASPLSAGSMRAALGAVALVTFALARGERIPTDRRTWLGIAIVAGLITTFSSALLILGVDRLSAGLSALIASTMPLFAALIARFTLAERLESVAYGGLAVGFVGVAVLASPSLAGDSALAGVALLLAAGLLWAAGVVFQKGWDFGGTTSVMQVGLQLVISCPSVAVLAAVDGWDADLGLDLLAPLAYSAIVAMAVPFALIAYIGRNAPATVAASSAYLVPPFGVLIAWLVRGEVLEPLEVAGGALVIVGVVLVTLGQTRRPASA